MAQIPPSVAIKTAQEFLAADRKEDAAQALIESLTSKRYKQWQPEMESVISLLLDTCIKTQNFKMAKDALHQYRSICQSQNLASLEKVILEFLGKVDVMMVDATQAATKLVEKTLAEEESVESMILRSINGEELAERTKKLSVSSAQKFMWESYRAVMDLIRNKQKLESLYHKTAQMVMQFCLNNERKSDFRRIGDLLRSHWSQLVSQSPAPNNISTVLSGPSSIQFFFSVRFEYLDHAVKLELWQEAFKTVEDISEICSVLKRQPPPQMLANYYKRLAQLFWVSHNYVFHAYAWLRFYVLSKNQNRTLTDSDLQKMASLVLISALSVPIDSAQFNEQYFEFNIQKEKNTRLTALLGLGSNLNRDTLLKELISHGIPTCALPELRDLYRLLEDKFHPLELCNSLKPIFEFISTHPTLTRYTTMIKKVCFTRQLQQLSKVYKTLSLKKLCELAPVDSSDAVEKLIVKCANNHLISVRIDHKSQKICFEDNALETGTIKNQLSVIYEKLSTAVQLIQPERKQACLDHKKKVFKKAPSAAEEENENFLERLEQIEDEKEKEEEIEALKSKLAKLKKKLVAAKAPLLAEEQQIAEAPALVKDGPPPLPTNTSPEEEAKRQEEEARQAVAQKEKVLKEKIISLTYKMDYLERARREVELPLLEQWFVDSCKESKERYERETAEFSEQHKENHKRELQEKKRLAKVLPEKASFENRLKAQYEAEMKEWEVQNRKIQEQIAQEQEKIKQRIREERIRQEEERKQRDKERREREEQERQEAEDRARREQEEHEKAERIRVQQLEKEREALQRNENRYGAPGGSRPSTGGKWSTPRQVGKNEGKWRSSQQQDSPSGKWGGERDSKWSRGRDSEPQERESKWNSKPRDSAPAYSAGPTEDRRRPDADSRRPRDSDADSGSRWGRRSEQTSAGPTEDRRRPDADSRRPRDSDSDSGSRWGRKSDQPSAGPTEDRQRSRDSETDSGSRWGRRSEHTSSGPTEDRRRPDADSRRPKDSDSSTTESRWKKTETSGPSDSAPRRWGESKSTPWNKTTTNTPQTGDQQSEPKTWKKDQGKFQPRSKDQQSRKDSDSVEDGFTVVKKRGKH